MDNEEEAERPPTHFACSPPKEQWVHPAEDEIGSDDENEEGEQSRKRKRNLTDGSGWDTKVLRRLSPVKPLQTKVENSKCSSKDPDGDSGVDVNGACEAEESWD